MPFDSTEYKADAVVREPWRQVLLDAADRIERVGWCQNTGSDDDGRSCGFNAVARSLYDVGKSPAIEISHINYLDICGKLDDFIGGEGFIQFNDAPGRTAAEVCAALRNCANQ